MKTLSCIAPKLTTGLTGKHSHHDSHAKLWIAEYMFVYLCIFRLLIYFRHYGHTNTYIEEMKKDEERESRKNVARRIGKKDRERGRMENRSGKKGNRRMKDTQRLYTQRQ